MTNMWKPTNIRCMRTDALKTGWNYFLQIFETLPGSSKDEK